MFRHPGTTGIYTSVLSPIDVDDVEMRSTTAGAITAVENGSSRNDDRRGGIMASTIHAVTFPSAAHPIIACCTP